MISIGKDKNYVLYRCTILFIAFCPTYSLYWYNWVQIYCMRITIKRLRSLYCKSVKYRNSARAQTECKLMQNYTEIYQRAVEWVLQLRDKQLISLMQQKRFGTLIGAKKCIQEMIWHVCSTMDQPITQWRASTRRIFKTWKGLSRLWES